MFSRYTAVRLRPGESGLKLHSLTFRLEQQEDDINIAFGVNEEEG